MKILPSSFVFVLTCLPLIGIGQRTITDTQLWPGTSLEFNLPKKWAFTAQYRSRFIEDVTYYKGSYLFGILEYDFNKNFRGVANYRLALVDRGVFHRYFLGVSARVKLNHWTLNFRPAIQYQNQRFIGDDEIRFDTDAYFRPRLTLKYKLNKKFDVYAYAEPFYALKKNLYFKTDNWQNSVGLKYEFIKNQVLNPYFIWQPILATNNAKQNFIMGLDLEFSIKPFKKSKHKKKLTTTRSSSQ
ncbi:DUF2490 domain-containing protein [Runella sp. MFBS21]|uniref:DUF2490 domain-containing protein n=1 Tax=Runella sp. MFBS21 TaxID=3034018 RepID=UPI0023F66A7D|nr:DUF2490 domain-containing protein [Runella sp. MFBS21]MDF7821445.1 DUF2490 domain-containing protein [Runella sp. MFBS21]